MSENNQPVEKMQMSGMIDLHHMFPTIQGEGPFVGTPAVFVRLAGCNLQCPACDTDYTSKRQMFKARDLVAEVQKISARPRQLVVITGGEPFRQSLRPFVDKLLEYDYRVQIETNGVLYQDLAYSFISVVCSPKTPRISPELEPYLCALKYVVRAGEIDPKDGLPLTTMGMTTPVARPGRTFRGEVFVQPLDEGHAGKNLENEQAAVESCMKFGYRLSIQTHKIIGLE